jgi:tripartite-type tricarboxylate transporter receptor subunit TctC
MLPDVPLVSDTVLGYEHTGWFGLMVPTGTPRPIIDKLNAALNAALATEEVRQRLAIEGAEPQPTTPEAYGAIIDREVAMWSDLVKAAGIKPE